VEVLVELFLYHPLSCLSVFSLLQCTGLLLHFEEFVVVSLLLFESLPLYVVVGLHPCYYLL
jgi:hypothetical protein